MAQEFRKEKAEGSVRLNKYMSDAGFCSRREADRLIEAGRVLLDGNVAQMGSRVEMGQRVTVDGKALVREEEMILLAVNKPRGVVCTTDRRWGDQTIYDLLQYPKRVFSIGRLDKDSEGLLLMTNNGDILNKIMRAGNYHEKEYVVTVHKEITPEFLKTLADGVYLKELDVTTRPCQVRKDGTNRFRIILTQGLNRQIRRMCEACHYRVTRLKRVRIMNIELGELKPGEYRSVSRREYAKLQELLRDSKNPGEPYSDCIKNKSGQTAAREERRRESSERASHSWVEGQVRRRSADAHGTRNGAVRSARKENQKGKRRGES